MRGIGWISNVLQDLRYALRGFRRAPGFTIFVISVLALSMGANLATFSVTQAILIRLLPVKDPGSLFRTVSASGNAYDSGSGCSYRLFLEMQTRSTAFSELMAYQPAEFVSVSAGQSGTQRLMQQTVSGNYFSVLGVQAASGRMISNADDRDSAQYPVAVISYRFWQDRFEKSPRTIGSKLSFGEQVYDIIGVAPPEFFGVEVGKIVDVWTPVSMAPAANLSDDHNFFLRPVGRLKPGVTIAQAAAPLAAVINEFMLQDVRLHAPPGTPKAVINQFLAGMRIKGVQAGSGISSLRRQYERPIQITMFVVGLVMLIACLNVASLLIERGSVRRQEIAVRLSLGAGVSRICQQLLTESLLLALVAALAGLWVAHWATPALVGLLTPSTDPASMVTTIDFRLLAFTLLLTLVTSLACGLLPAIRLASPDVYFALKSGRRLVSVETGQTGKFLLAGQIALSLVLVIGSGLFARTLTNLLSSYLGFDPANVLITRLFLRNPSDQKSPFAAWDDLLIAVRSCPGLEFASLSSGASFIGEPQLMGVRTTAAKTLPVDPVTGLLFVSPDYFSTLNIAFVAGRNFSSSEELLNGPAVAIVNQAFARKFFGDENPLGRKLTKLANDPAWTLVVGIVRDVKVNSLRVVAPPTIYIPYGRMTDWIPPQGQPGISMFLQVRGRQSVSSLTNALHPMFASRLAIGSVFRQEQLIGDTLVRERLLATVASVFAALAVLLAALGLYAIMSYAVMQRRQEIGVRMALGADPVSIQALILRDSTMVVSLGILVGLIVAVIASHWVRTLLYGLAPNDTATFLSSAALLVLIALLAAFIPAYRAAKADPMIALRHE